MRDELVPVTDARSRLNDLIRAVLPDRNVVLLRHGRPVGILIDPDRFEALIDRIEDLEDAISVLEHRADPDTVAFADVADPVVASG